MAAETATVLYTLTPYPKSLLDPVMQDRGEEPDSGALKNLLTLSYGLPLSEGSQMQVVSKNPLSAMLELSITGSPEDHAALRWAFFKDGAIPFQVLLEFRRVAFRPEERAALIKAREGVEPVDADWIAAWRSGAGKKTALAGVVLINTIEAHTTSTKEIPEPAPILLEGLRIEATIQHQDQGAAMLHLRWKSQGGDTSNSETITQLQLLPGHPTVLTTTRSGNTGATELIWVTLLWMDEAGKPLQAPEAGK